MGWAKSSHVPLNKAKCWVLCLAHSNLMQPHRPGEGWLEMCPVEKDVGLLVGGQLNMCQQRARVSRKADGIPACMRTSVASRAREVIALGHGSGEPAPRILRSVWGPDRKKDV